METFPLRNPGIFVGINDHENSVVDPKLLFSDPDPALGLIPDSDPDPALGLIPDPDSDPDSDPDPACLTKVIRLYLICPQESIAQRFSSHFRR